MMSGSRVIARWPPRVIPSRCFLCTSLPWYVSMLPHHHLPASRSCGAQLDDKNTNGKQTTPARRKTGRRPDGGSQFDVHVVSHPPLHLHGLVHQPSHRNGRQSSFPGLSRQRRRSYVDLDPGWSGVECASQLIRGFIVVDVVGEMMVVVGRAWKRMLDSGCSIDRVLLRRVRGVYVISVLLPPVGNSRHISSLHTPYSSMISSPRTTASTTSPKGSRSFIVVVGLAIGAQVRSFPFNIGNNYLTPPGCDQSLFPRETGEDQIPDPRSRFEKKVN